MPLRNRDFAWLILTGVLIGNDALSADDQALVPVETSDTVFAHPHDLTLGPGGRFQYVADMNNDLVKVLEPRSLKVLGTIGRGELSRPHDVALAGC